MRSYKNYKKARKREQMGSDGDGDGFKSLDKSQTDID